MVPRILNPNGDRLVGKTCGYILASGRAPGYPHLGAGYVRVVQRAAESFGPDRPTWNPPAHYISFVSQSRTQRMACLSHSVDRASWYICLIQKNKMHFSFLVLYIYIYIYIYVCVCVCVCVCTYIFEVILTVHRRYYVEIKCQQLHLVGILFPLIYICVA